MFRSLAGAAAPAERATPSSRQDVYWSRGRAEPSLGQPCPAAPRPGHPLPSPRFHPESRSPRRDPRAQPPVRARCRGEPALAAGGTSGVEQRPAGYKEVGAENPRRESRGRAALPGPRAGSGGRWRSCELQRGEGGPRRRPPTGGGRLRPAACSDLCVLSRRGPLAGGVGWLRASTNRAADSSVRPRVGAACSPRRSQLRSQAPGFRLSMQVAGTGACCPEWLEELREEAPQVFLPSTGARPEGLASQPPHCGCQGDIE